MRSTKLIHRPTVRALRPRLPWCDPACPPGLAEQLARLLDQCLAFGPGLRRLRGTRTRKDGLADAAIKASLRHAGKPLGRKMEEQADSLEQEIEDLRSRRAEAATAERSKPDLSTTQSAIGTVAALSAKLDSSTPEERTALRTSIIQQLRTAFFEVVFRPHAIVGLIELPDKPKSLKGAFGMPRPIVVRVIDGAERYFLSHLFFRDDPEELAALGAGKGVVFPRFV